MVAGNARPRHMTFNPLRLLKRFRVAGAASPGSTRLVMPHTIKD